MKIFEYSSQFNNDDLNIWIVMMRNSYFLPVVSIMFEIKRNDSFLWLRTRFCGRNFAKLNVQPRPGVLINLTTNLWQVTSQSFPNTKCQLDGFDVTRFVDKLSITHLFSTIPYLLFQGSGFRCKVVTSHIVNNLNYLYIS